MPLPFSWKNGGAVTPCSGHGQHSRPSIRGTLHGCSLWAINTCFIANLLWSKVPTMTIHVCMTAPWQMLFICHVCINDSPRWVCSDKSTRYFLLVHFLYMLVLQDGSRIVAIIIYPCNIIAAARGVYIQCFSGWLSIDDWYQTKHVL